MRKKKEEVTLIQCSVSTKKRVKEYAKKEGFLMNKMVDKIIAEYIKEKESIKCLIY